MTFPCSRRRACRLVGVGTFASVGGCVEFAPSSVDTRINALDAVNFTTEERTVHVATVEAGETTFSDSAVVPPAGRDTEQEGRSDPGYVTFDGYPTEPGAVEVRAWLAAESREEGSTFDLGAYDVECSKVRVRVGDPNEPDRTGLSIWRTFNCRTGD